MEAQKNLSNQCQMTFEIFPILNHHCCPPKRQKEKMGKGSHKNKRNQKTAEKYIGVFEMRCPLFFFLLISKGLVLRSISVYN